MVDHLSPKVGVVEKVDKMTLEEVEVTGWGEWISRVAGLVEAKRKREVMSGATEKDHMVQMKDMAHAVRL